MVAGEEFPQFDEFGEIFSFENQWHGLLPQTVTGIDCFNPAAVVNSDENLVVLKLTALEYREMFTALYAGAELQYPEKYLQVIANFLKGIHCPPVLEEQDCFEYLSYASFIRFEPVNPYIEPDTIPDGYLTQPFLVNGQNGVDVPNYEPFDILVPYDSLTLDVNWFEDIGGQLPQITIGVQGAGQVLVKLLTQVAGGLAVITVDNPPNLLDIIAGVLSGAENIMDLNLDIVALPPETAIEIDYPLQIVGAGLHTIYVVFLPILDDSLIPVRFGGGFRGVQLCDFVEQPIMGIQDIRFDDLTCQLQTLVDGVWTQVAGWETWLDCIPEGGGGGGGGGGSIASKVYRMGNIGFGTISTTSTTYVDMTGLTLNHTPTKANMLVIVDNILMLNSSGNQPVTVRILADGNAGLDAIEQAVSNSAQTDIGIADRWIVVPNVEIAIKLQWKTPSGTATRYERSSINVTIIEYDDAADLAFVQDIRILDGELQKKIGGVWLNVTESLAAMLAAIENTANTALINANSAIATNATQTSQIAAIVTVNNAQNVRLTDLETWQTDVDLSIAGLGVITDDHEGRLDALEAAAGLTPIWYSYQHAFTGGDMGNWESVDAELTAPVATFGLRSDDYIMNITQPLVVWASQRQAYMFIDYRVNNGGGAMYVEFIGQGDGAIEQFTLDGNTQRSYFRVPKITNSQAIVHIRLNNGSGIGNISLLKIGFIGLTSNMFSDGD